MINLCPKFTGFVCSKLAENLTILEIGIFSFFSIDNKLRHDIMPNARGLYRKMYIGKIVGI
jgi:hypothetical protein